MGSDEHDATARTRLNTDSSKLTHYLDDQEVAFFADSVANPDPGTGLFQLRENVAMTTSSAAYTWLNPLQIWATVTVDPAKGRVTVKGYSA